MNPGCQDARQGFGYSIADPLVDGNIDCSVECNKRAENISVVSREIWVYGRVEDVTWTLPQPPEVSDAHC